MKKKKNLLYPEVHVLDMLYTHFDLIQDYLIWKRESTTSCCVF